jgi:photosystem II stability/assembly factor-like uncharacterized protein
MKWRAIGPVNTSGRIDDLAVARVAGQPDAIYVATASGGVFKSTNAGTSWTPIFDQVDAMQSIGDVTVASSNPSVVWVGTGEPNNRQSSSWGDGVYKSVDAGQTWKSMGLVDTRHIGRIVIDPVNPDIVYVAALGRLWGSNSERGVFKTTDGGTTWRKTLSIDEHTGVTDLVMDPQNPKTLFAAAYQRQRKSWGFNGGGPGGGVYKSTDAGEHWTKLTKGLPQGDVGRIGLDVFKGDGKLVFAIIEAGGGRGRGAAAPASAAGAGAAPQRLGGLPAEAPPGAEAGGVYRTSDGGATWQRLSPQNPRPSYYSQIRVDPKDRNRVYMLGSNRGFLVSSDGGQTFVDTGVNGIHGEDHALWVDPDNNQHLIIGGDGGVSISRDRGRTWDFRANMPLGQFYEIDVDMKRPFTVCGGLQDNGEWCIPSAVRDRNGISSADAWNVGGGDGFYVVFDPTDNDYVYAESQNGNASRVNIVTRERQTVRPPGQGLRWNWDTPIHISPANPNVVYMAANMLFRSPDQGRTWAAISPDLTSQVDPATLPIMGAVTPPGAFSRNDGTSPLASLTSVGESPLNPQVIYVGAQDGTVQVTRDGGKTWTNLTSKLPGVPQFTYVSTVLPSRYAPGRVYVTLDGHYTDDYKPYVFVSEDYGQTWRSLVAGLPETSINRIREHPRDSHFLVLAHERGVHVSNDEGRTWIGLSLLTNLPTVSVDDAVIHPRDNALVIGTHGRSIWILDDVGPLQAFTAQATQSEAVLAPIAPARQMITYNPQAWFGSGVFFAPNPEFDAGISYYLRDAASGPVQIEIADVYGNVVRTMQGPSAKGVNRLRWDLRGEAPAAPAGAPTGQPAAGGRGRGGGGGSLVSPGKYVVTIRIPGLQQTLRGEVTVEGDPAKR